MYEAHILLYNLYRFANIFSMSLSITLVRWDARKYPVYGWKFFKADKPQDTQLAGLWLHFLNYEIKSNPIKFRKFEEIWSNQIHKSLLLVSCW